MLVGRVGGWLKVGVVEVWLCALFDLSGVRRLIVGCMPVDGIACGVPGFNNSETPTNQLYEVQYYQDKSISILLL